MRQRLLYIDYIKGYGITLVVVGHVIGGLYATELITAEGITYLLYNIIYTFHMALFFFISGFLSSKILAQHPVEFARDAFGTLVFPYLLWSWLFMGLREISPGTVVNHYPAWHFIGILSPLYTVSVYWFLYALFFAKTSYLLACSYYKIPLHVVFVAFMMVYFSAELSISISYADSSYTTVIVNFSKAGTFVGFGLITATRKKVLDSLLVPHLIPLYAVGWIVTTSLILDSDRFNIFRFPNGFFGTILTLSLAHRIELGGKIRLWYLAEVGRATLAIFVAHTICIWAMRAFLLKVPISNALVHLALETAAGIVLPMLLFYVASRLRIAPYVGLGKNAFGSVADRPISGRRRSIRSRNLRTF
jgi:fucose 4-O-acetylase-like acetyltransferase